jgi:response regulator RpfG family c-di-GMP phosphodiesterase
MASESHDPEMDAAPSCPHDDLEAYFEGSPLADSFAPGMLDEVHLAAPTLTEETPWRGRSGHAPDQNALAARAERARKEIEATLSPEELAARRARIEELQVAATAAATATAVPASSTTSLKVLVVHPNLGTRRQVADALGDFGFDITTSGSGEQAVLQVLHDRPQAVLCEIGNPDFDALEFCRTVNERSPGTPVVVVAPGDDEAHYSLSMESGAADYLRRPVTPPFVAERLRAVIEKAHAARAAAVADGGITVVPAGTARALDRELRRQELKIQSLFELSKNVVGSLELDELYHGFLLTAMGQLGLSCGALFHLNDTQNRNLVEVTSRGVAAADAKRLLDFRAGLGAYLLSSPHPVLLEADCVPVDLRTETEALRTAGFAVACPMACKGSPVGVALFGPRMAGGALGPEDLLLLSAVCNFAGPALDSARLYTELQNTYLSTVRAFVSSLEAKDAYTRGHSERVADYARVLGAALGLKRRDLDMVIFGAMLHDIGKIGVAEGILNKPAPLSPEEWRVVRSHPEMGARIVSHIDYLTPAVGPILHHHERIDGRGYPHGLAGEEIEFGARVVTVVDSFDAMTTHRPYRRAMEVGQAVRLLRVHAGRQFDAAVVDTFIDLLEKGHVVVHG